MMPSTRTYPIAANGGQVPLALDYMPTSDITVSINAGPGEAFLVQVTLDDVFDQDAPNYVVPASARWQTVTGAPTVTTGYVTFAGPWRAARLNITAPLIAALTFGLAQSTTPRA